MPVYEGDPGIEIKAWTALAKGDSSNVSFLHFGAHTGTHVDAPAHFIEGARRIDALSLETLIGAARVIRVPDEVMEIDVDFLAKCDLDQIERVLFHTRNSKFWSEGFRKDFTHLSPEAAEKLVDLGVKLVGTDYLSIERFHSGHHRTHLALLSQFFLGYRVTFAGSLIGFAWAFGCGFAGGYFVSRVYNLLALRRERA